MYKRQAIRIAAIRMFQGYIEAAQMLVDALEEKASEYRDAPKPVSYTHLDVYKRQVKDFVMETVELAGPNPCPPIVVGVGLGGTMDKATILAKEALMLSLIHI